MKVLAHDLDTSVFAQLFTAFGGDIVIFDQTHKISPCAGCFGCWLKTPSTCVIKDDFRRMGALYAQCEEVILISNCAYGCYSPFIKNVLDRSINWVLPFMVTRNHEMHHPIRYENRFRFTVCFYGADITEAEKQTANKLVKANAVNFDASETTLYFFDDIRALKGISL